MESKKKLVKLSAPPKIINFPKEDEIPSEINYVVKFGNYYGYNVEDINDYGWGCAWRCIQMCLNNYLISIKQEERMLNFEKLFNEFGSKEKLLMIYKNMTKSEEIVKLLNSAKFSPHELENGWAEPFIGQLVLFHFGVKRSLRLINGYPKNANAPISVFNPEKLKFEQFLNLLWNNFKNEENYPVMIDDASFAYCIIGISGSWKDNITLYIADPHIGKEAFPKFGIYTVTLDKYGKFISSSVKETDRKNLYMFGCDRYIDFQEKPWMILI